MTIDEHREAVMAMAERQREDERERIRREVLILTSSVRPRLTRRVQA